MIFPGALRAAGSQFILYSKGPVKLIYNFVTRLPEPEYSLFFLP